MSDLPTGEPREPVALGENATGTRWPDRPPTPEGDVLSRDLEWFDYEFPTVNDDDRRVHRIVAALRAERDRWEKKAGHAMLRARKAEARVREALFAMAALVTEAGGEITVSNATITKLDRRTTIERTAEPDGVTFRCALAEDEDDG